MKFKRRLRQLLLSALITSAGSAMAATLFSEAWNDLTKYFKAAASLVLQAAIGLDNTRFDILPPAHEFQRGPSGKLKDQLDILFLEQSTLVSQFEFFVKIARDPSKTPAERTNYWDNNVLPRISTVSEAVSQVRIFSEKWTALQCRPFRRRAPRPGRYSRRAQRCPEDLREYGSSRFVGRGFAIPGAD